MKFTMWGPFHLFFIASPILFAVLCYFIFRKSSRRTQRIAGIVFSSVAVLLLILRNLEILAKNGWTFDPEVVPLQVCHLANFVLLFAFIFDSKALFAFAFCFNLPAATMSIIFANSLVNYATVLTARGIAYIVGHMLIVGITLYAYIFRFVRMDKKTFFSTIGIVLGLYVVSLFVNNLFNYLSPEHTANFFYSILPENGSPLEWFFELGKVHHIGSFQINPIYMLLTCALGVVIVSTLYGVHCGIDRLRNKKRQPLPKDSSATASH